MIKFKLHRLGGATIEFEPDSVITFPAGLPGFETCIRFKMLHEEGRPTAFFLQSLDNPDLLFSLGDPTLLNLSYEVVLSDEEQKLLDSAPGDELLLVVIVYKEKAEDSSPDFVKVNLRGPIIINVTKRRGMQKILKELDAQVAIRGA